MECPQCKRDVDVLHGSGKYPNSTYKCGTCYDDGWGTITKWMFAIIGIGIVVALIIQKCS